MKIKILVLMLGWWLALAGGVRADDYGESFGQGILKIQTESVPHLDKNGKIVTSWTPNSMFTRIVWNADAGPVDWLGGQVCPDKSYNGLSEIKSAGFNTVFGPRTSEAVTLAKNAGLKTLVYVGQDCWTTYGATGGIDCYKRTAEFWRDRSEVIGYYLFDENVTLGGMNAELWKTVAQSMREKDPNKFYFANWNQMGDEGQCGAAVQTLREVDELSSGDFYPLHCNGGTAGAIYDVYKPWYNNCFDTNKVPLMPILQGFGGTRRENCEDGDTDYVIPSENELRRQVYFSITGGATGFWYFLFHSARHCTINQFSKWDQCVPGGWCGLNEHANPEGWAAVKKINEEIATYEKQLLSPVVWQGYEVWGVNQNQKIKSVFRAPKDEFGVVYALVVGGNQGGWVKIKTPKKIVKVDSLLKPDKVITHTSKNNYFEYNSSGGNGDLIDMFRITYIRGDANGDGVTGMADFGTWKTEYVSGVGKSADFDGSGRVGLIDFGIWKNGYLGI